MQKNDNISFSHGVKKEILKNRPFRVHHKSAQAYGLLLFGKSFNEDSISITTEYKSVARLYSNMISDLIHIENSITMRESKHGDNMVYTVSLDNISDRQKLLEYFGHGDRKIEQINPENFTKEDDEGAFLSGAYLACGNITDPQKYYQLEFLVQDENISKCLYDALSVLIAPPKVTIRRNIYVVYYKESEHIEDLLTLIGASNSSLEMMEVKIYKDLRNKVNRVTNCETANIEKTVNASSAQIEDIRFILSTKGEEYIPEELKELAMLRLDNPDMSLRELQENLSDKISRSGINHRLKRISSIAQKLRE